MPSRGRDELEIHKDEFGALPDGTRIDRYTFSNGRVTIKMITYGARIQAVRG